jgi:hypothetical protein
MKSIHDVVDCLDRWRLKSEFFTHIARGMSENVAMRNEMLYMRRRLLLAGMLAMVCLVAASARAVNPISSVNFYTDGEYPYKMTWAPIEDCGGCVEVCVGKLVPRSLEEAFPMECTTVGATEAAANSAAKLQANLEQCFLHTEDSVKLECISAITFVG